MEESSTYQAILQKGRVAGIEIGIEQGVRQGIEQGVRQGIEQGVRQGIEQGVRQGIEQGVRQGKEIGVALGEQHLLLRLGTQRFGTPSVSEQKRIETITSIAQLEQLADRLLKVNSWAELLA